jgi:hypothetical protein
MTSYAARLESPLGGITLESDGESLTGLWFDGQAHFAASPDAADAPDLPVFRETRRWLALYFGGAEPDFTPPLAPRGHRLPPRRVGHPADDPARQDGDLRGDARPPRRGHRGGGRSRRGRSAARSPATRSRSSSPATASSARTAL